MNACTYIYKTEMQHLQVIKFKNFSEFSALGTKKIKNKHRVIVLMKDQTPHELFRLALPIFATICPYCVLDVTRLFVWVNRGH